MTTFVIMIQIASSLPESDWFNVSMQIRRTTPHSPMRDSEVKNKLHLAVGTTTFLLSLGYPSPLQANIGDWKFNRPITAHMFSIAIVFISSCLVFMYALLEVVMYHGRKFGAVMSSNECIRIELNDAFRCAILINSSNY